MVLYICLMACPSFAAEAEARSSTAKEAVFLRSSLPSRILSFYRLQPDTIADDESLNESRELYSRTLFNFLVTRV